MINILKLQQKLKVLHVKPESIKDTYERLYEACQPSGFDITNRLLTKYIGMFINCYEQNTHILN
jgi:hypothetical protein